VIARFWLDGRGVTSTLAVAFWYLASASALSHRQPAARQAAFKHLGGGWGV